jgi:NTP pyrophosphatase (non-canonical NTP hydrolase)
MTHQMTLNDYQALIAGLIVERGFDSETIPEVFTLLVEEVGELAKAIRKYNGQKTHADSEVHHVAEEIADIFWLLIDLSNRLNVDLAMAFTAKEEKNKQRKVIA